MLYTVLSAFFLFLFFVVTCFGNANKKKAKEREGGRKRDNYVNFSTQKSRLINSPQFLLPKKFTEKHDCYGFCNHKPNGRVGHRVLLSSFKACNVLLRSFFEFLATYETQKNDAFFCVLFLRT